MHNVTDQYLLLVISRGDLRGAGFRQSEAANLQELSKLEVAIAQSLFEDIFQFPQVIILQVFMQVLDTGLELLELGIVHILDHFISFNGNTRFGQPQQEVQPQFDISFFPAAISCIFIDDANDLPQCFLRIIKL